MREYAPAAVIVLLSSAAYFFSYQANHNRHFGIGRWDGAFLANRDDFHPPSRMSGPFRHPDDSVEVREFVGRLTKREARFRIPYHARGSPLELRVRCHRFGLQGTVGLTVNDRHIEDFVFTRESYPWGGIRGVIPQDVAETGPLRIALSVRGGNSPPDNLPADLGIGVDWIEVSSRPGSLLFPTSAQWLGFLALVISSWLFLRFLPASPRATATGLTALSVLVVAAIALEPVTAARAISSAWLAGPILIVLLRGAELLDRFFPRS